MCCILLTRWRMVIAINVMHGVVRVAKCIPSYSRKRLGGVLVINIAAKGIIHALYC